MKVGIWKETAKVSFLINRKRRVVLTIIFSHDPRKNTFTLSAMGADVAALYTRVTALKALQPGLKVWISIGGWAMNDPGPSRTTFSDLAASKDAQENFFNSLVTFMRANNFDGVDIDWQVLIRFN
jgi:GH18 family chitinase